MHASSGPMKARPASLLYTSWVHESGADICGQAHTAEARGEHVYRLDAAALYLDSRRPESSSGALGDVLWRDLSGAQHDVDVSPSLMARAGGYFACVPAGPVPPAKRASAAKRTSAARFSFGTVTRKLKAQAAADDGATLRVRSAPKLEGALAAGQLSVTLVTQCTSDAAETASHLALRLGNLVVGAGPSRDSLTFRVRGSEQPAASILMAPGQESRLRTTRVHQLTLRGTQLDYYANGAHVSGTALPAPVAPSVGARDDVWLEIGAATDEAGSLWTFEGAIFLVLVHTECLPHDALQRIAATCLADSAAWARRDLTRSPKHDLPISPTISHRPSTGLPPPSTRWGAPRPGDASTDGAQLHHEMHALRIDSTLLYLDSRAVSHQLLLQSSSTAQAGLPPASLVDELLGGEFTCTAVASISDSPCGELLLLCDYWFDGLAELQGKLHQSSPRGTRPAEAEAAAAHHHAGPQVRSMAFHWPSPGPSTDLL